MDNIIYTILFFDCTKQIILLLIIFYIWIRTLINQKHEKKQIIKNELTERGMGLGWVACLGI